MGEALRYLSLFSGIGGLESSSASPLLLCEQDPECALILARRFPHAEIIADVRRLHPPDADCVVGGWPCQDLSVAGLRRGLGGERSGLFFEMIRVAVEARAHTIVAENVPNLLHLDDGQNFDLVLQTFAKSGFPYVAWRTLNAREFALPHDRRRIFIIATKHRELAIGLHRELPQADGVVESVTQPAVSAFYWTAGTQSICYSYGYTPTLKVGSSLSIASPPAIHFAHVVRLLRPTECLRLQGFDAKQFDSLPARAIYRMAGNAVTSPVGKFVVDTLTASDFVEPLYAGFGYTSPAGLYENGTKRAVDHRRTALASNLGEFIDRNDHIPLSARAASGVLRRLEKSGKPCPNDLKEDLRTLARQRAAWPDALEGDYARESRVHTDEQSDLEPAAIDPDLFD